MNSRKLIEGLGPLVGKRHRPITPHAGSWADQEAKRPRKLRTPEEERLMRAGIVHPDIAKAPVLKGYEHTDAKGRPLRTEMKAFTRNIVNGWDRDAKDVFRQQRIASPEGKAVQQHLGMRSDDMGVAVGSGGMRRFPTNAPGEGGGGPGSTAGILLGQAGYKLWARDMHERGNTVPTWDEGTPYHEEGMMLVDQLLSEAPGDLYLGTPVPDPADAPDPIRQALQALVDAHDSQMLTSEEWDNARRVLGLPPAETDDVAEGVSAPDRRRQSYAPGTRVRVSGGSGIDSDKVGTVVDRSEVKTDGRGIASNIMGHYKPTDWSREVAVRLDDGTLITMFKNRLLPVSKDFRPMRSGVRHDPQILADLEAKGMDVSGMEPR